MIKFDKNEFLKPQIYSTLDECETRCNVTKEIIEEIEQLQQENKKYKEVIDKAIEYIKNASYFDGSGMCANDLLEILKGSDK